MIRNYKLLETISVSLVFPFLLFVLAFYFRFEHIQTYPIAGDEPFSAYVAQFSLKNSTQFLLQGNNPPLYEIMLHFWIKMFGIGQISLRMPSVIFSSFVPVVVYFLGKRINLFVGILASFITVLSNVNIYFGQEGRIYALVELLSVLAVLVLYLFFETKQTRFLYLVSILNTLLLYAHYLSAFIVLAQIFGTIIFLSQNKWQKELIKKLFLSYLGTFILFAPVLYNFIGLATNYGTWLSPPDNWVDYWRVIQLFFNNHTVLFYLFVIITVISFLQGRDRRVVMPLYLWLILAASFFAYTLNYIISFKYPVWGEKYTLWSTPFFYLLFAYSISKLFTSWHIRSIAVISITYFMYMHFDNKISNGRHLDSWVQEYKKQQRNVNATYIVPSYLNIAFTYHYDKAIFKRLPDEPISLSNYDGVINSALAKDSIFPIHNINEVDSSKKQIIFMGNFSDFKDEGKQQLEYLQTVYKIDTAFSFWEKMRIYKLSKK